MLNGKTLLTPSYYGKGKEIPLAKRHLFDNKLRHDGKFLRDIGKIADKPQSSIRSVI